MGLMERKLEEAEKKIAKRKEAERMLLKDVLTGGTLKVKTIQGQQIEFRKPTIGDLIEISKHKGWDQVKEFLYRMFKQKDPKVTKADIEKMPFDEAMNIYVGIVEQLNLLKLTGRLRRGLAQMRPPKA